MTAATPSLTDQQLIEETKQFVKATLEKDCSGHDWWHIQRVWQLACTIAQQEKANQLVVELAALLHDIADWKFHDGDLEAGAKESRRWLSSLNVNEATINAVCNIVANVSFKGAGVKEEQLSLEGQIVRDADRLDAIGAIGVARAFAYGGSKNRPLYDPNNQPQQHDSFEAYKNDNGTTINHFYEKLLLLKDRLHTQTAKQLAEERHQFMEHFLQQFYKEWRGTNG